MWRNLGWSFASVVTLICGVVSAVLHWWVVMHLGLWPYIVFELIPGVLGLAFGVYALRQNPDSKVAWLGLALTVSPLVTWLGV